MDFARRWLHDAPSCHVVAFLLMLAAPPLMFLAAQHALPLDLPPLALFIFANLLELTSMNLTDLHHVFTERFGRPPELVVRAPGRVNLLASTSIINDGLVLPAAIDRRYTSPLLPVAPPAPPACLDLGKQ